MRDGRKAGFTLIEMLIVTAIIATLVAILVPVIGGVLAKARFAACEANLKIVGKAFHMYDPDYKGNFPVLYDSISAPAGVNDAMDSNDDVWHADLGTNAMQSVWLLISGGWMPESGFECPADGDYLIRPAAAHKYGWTSRREFSYGIHWPYSGIDTDSDGTLETVNEADPSNKNVHEQLAIMADWNPDGGISGPLGHSMHPRNGANVLLVSGSAIKYTQLADSLAGIGKDDIYVDENGDDYVPDSDTDTVIVPYNWSGRESS